MVYSHNIILPSNEHEWTKTTHSNMAECHKNNVEQKKPDTSSFVVQRVKDPALSLQLLWYRFDPWAKNFQHAVGEGKKKKRRSQTQKSTYCVILFTEKAKQTKLVSTIRNQNHVYP